MSYDDDQLAAAIAASRSWRGVMRALGLPATSTGRLRTARVRAERLALDHSHFTGQRRWSEQRLAEAVASASSWRDVARTLGLSTAASTTQLRAHATRLGLPIAHLTADSLPDLPGPLPVPELDNLPRAGALLAAAWFQLAGREVSWPLEPSAYDLVVGRHRDLRKIQVKTTRVRAGSTWKVSLTSGRRDSLTYAPEEVDDFFIIDGDMRFYLVPFAVVGGLKAVHVARYDRYRLQQL